MLEFNPHLSKIFTFESDLDPVLRQLKAENYDLIVDLHHNIRSLRIKLALGKPAIGFNKLNIRKWLYVNLKMDIMPEIHIVERYLETVKVLGIEDDGKGLDFFPCECDAVSIDDLPYEFQESGFAVLSIGGTHFTKKMPEIQWVELIKRIPVPAILIGGKEEYEAGKSIEELSLAKGFKVWNGCGKFSVGSSAHLIQKSVLVATHDTGMMHIASAFHKPIVAIWGNTTPKLGMYPFRTEHFNLEVANLTCRPCSKIGFSACPKGHFKCMKNQNFDQPKLIEFIRNSIYKNQVNG